MTVSQKFGNICAQLYGIRRNILYIYLHGQQSLEYTDCISHGGVGQHFKKKQDSGYAVVQQKYPVLV